jgi:hypothetical protein
MYKAYTTELKNVRKHPNVQIYALECCSAI